MTTLSIIIPVFNEIKTIELLLKRVIDVPLSGIQKEVIIVESNSTDGTREVVQKFVANHSHTPSLALRLVLQQNPLGKGNATREGFKSATGDIILIQDGDLEYDVNDYPQLLQPILENKSDCVLGSRHLSAGNWKIRKFEKDPLRSVILNFGGLFFHSYFNLLYGVRLTDPTTMYKVFRRRCLKDLCLTANRFDFDYELLGKLIRAGYSPLEVPISYSSRGFTDGKKVRMFRDPLMWLWAIAKHRFSRLKIEVPV